MSEITMPFDMQLEDHVIGCMIFDPNCIGDLIECGLKPAHFYNATNAKVCDHLFDVWQEDPKQVDLQLVGPKLAEYGVSITRLMEIIRSIPTAANVTYYAERVKVLAVLREAVKLGGKLIQARDLRDPEDIRELITRADGKLGKLNETQVKADSIKTVKDVLDAYHEEFEKRYYAADSTGVTGIPSGLKDLDNLTAGFQDSDLIVIAARPSVGKTAFCLNIALNVSLRKNPDGTVEPGETVGIFSLEMPATQLVGRMISSEANIDQQALKTGLILKSDWERYTTALSRISKANLFIDDEPGQSMTDIRVKARKIKREKGLRLVLIDYLGMIAGKPGLTRYDLVSENIREAKNMARELECPVIMLCQLSRKVEERQDKRPMLSDLRESGEIEQTADVIAFLYRDDYYNKESDKKNITEIIIAKNRNGPIGTVETVFVKQYGKFLDLSYGR